MRVFLVVTASVLVLACLALAQEGPSPLPEGTRIDRLIVDKSDHFMEAYAGETLVRRYRVSIGQGGLGPKRWEGDLRTPEGEYRIDRRHVSSDYHRFLHVSYPNDTDRRRYRRSRAAGEVPEGAGIGSAIGIHGPPAALPSILHGALTSDWTAGCISVAQPEIDDLYRAVVPNARLEIRP